MLDYHPVILSLLISLAIQAVFFSFAVSLKTDKVTDLSYGLTFIILAIFWLFRQPEITTTKLLLAVMITVWGVRLASYLVVRILKTKRDKRFDGIREKFWSFAKFWLLQGVSVWVIMLPAVYYLTADFSVNPTLVVVGTMIWLTGLMIESIADIQLFRFKNNSKNKDKWIESGLWRYSRHPNYFGEILVWWGVLIFGINNLSDWWWLVIVGPIFITCLLLFVSGIPILEKNNDKRWGEQKAYQQYKKSTSLLMLWPKKSR